MDTAPKTAKTETELRDEAIAERRAFLEKENRRLKSEEENLTAIANLETANQKLREENVKKLAAIKSLK